MFDINKYEELVKDVIGDAFYVDGTSNKTKISRVRDCAELVVRKLLNLGEESKVTLGDHKIIEALKEKYPEEETFHSTLDELRVLSNSSAHTQVVSYSDDEFEHLVELLLYLYSFLFISFFRKYEFGYNLEVVSAFSILPPKIRVTILEELFKFDNENVVIIDKLSLAILKDSNKDNAANWLNEHKASFSNMASVSRLSRESYEGSDDAYFKMLVETAPSIYITAMDNLNEVSNTLDEKGIMYSSFEEAKELYLEKGILPELGDEEREFNDIMKFVYLGRKSVDNPRLNENYSSLVPNNYLNETKN